MPGSIIEQPRVAFIQDGARLHYALPLALEQRGLLHIMFTDWFVRRGSLEASADRLLSLINSRRLAAMSQRRCDSISRERIVSFPAFTIAKQFVRRRFCSDVEYFAWESDQHRIRIERHGLSTANTLMGFIRNVHPNLLAWAKSRGIRTIADQIIAPAAIEEYEDRIQRQRFPDWETSPLSNEYAFVREFEQRTWNELDAITCASGYVRDSLIAQGIAQDKISVIPYPIDPAHFPFIDRANRTGPLTVGFIGKVCLRKGAPYFLEVARQLHSKSLRFVMVGPVGLSEKVRKAFSPHVELAGPMPRGKIAEWLAQFDIFLFPSTCEGSAGAISEAMASGLPVIATPNSGTPVEQGKNGFIHHYDETNGLAASIELLATNSNLRLSIGRAARTAIEHHTPDFYANQLLLCLQQSCISKHPNTQHG